jgi:diguanylate cyclase (GGDEF)-like protein
MLLFVPALLLLIQFGIFLFLPSISRPAAYISMVVAPLLAGLAVLWRGHLEREASRIGWYAIALSLAIWSLGSLGNLWQELILGHADEMYRTAMLAFALSAVPLAFILAGDWRMVSRPMARATDAVVALALGYAFFLYTWSVLTARGEPDDAGVISMVWLLDAQNLFLTLGALVRWYAGDVASERRLFGTLFIYQLMYQVLLFVNNHYIAADASFAPYQTELAAIVNIAFAVLAVAALHPTGGLPAAQADVRLSRLVRATSPALLAGALLLVSLFLIRVNYAIGTAGILIAVAGYTLRNTFNQARHIERGDKLQKERSELQAIAWSDSLTGLANRYMLDRTLGAMARANRPLAKSLAVLMVDIDHFKNLNDRYGHPTGDACLKAVASALQGAMVRPHDIVARYGGEEFIVLIEDTDAAGATVVAERLRVAVHDLAIENLGSPLGIVTVSVGAANANRNQSVSAEHLVATADRALYAAKNAGRNRTHTMSAVPG